MGASGEHGVGRGPPTGQQARRGEWEQQRTCARSAAGWRAAGAGEAAWLTATSARGAACRLLAWCHANQPLCTAAWRCPRATTRCGCFLVGCSPQTRLPLSRQAAPWPASRGPAPACSRAACLTCSPGQRLHGVHQVLHHVRALPPAALLPLRRVRQLRGQVRPPLPLGGHLHRPGARRSAGGGCGAWARWSSGH